MIEDEAPAMNTMMDVPQQAADVEQAARLRKDLERAVAAAEAFRKQQHVACERADAAERVAESCRAALRVLEPDKASPYEQATGSNAGGGTF